MVTIFKDVYNKSTPFYRAIDFVFDRIKSGTSKPTVDLIRSSESKEYKEELKLKLPAICFSGLFTTRSIDGCTEHSGYICLDFDSYQTDEDKEKEKQRIIKDNYTMALFTSPKGNGFKVIVKIPKEVDKHHLFFNALELHFNSSHIDKKCKDVSRACFESYDPDIYINKDSLEWTEYKEELGEKFVVKPPIIPVDDQDEILKRLIKWFEKNYDVSEGQRNHNIYIFSSACNDFGVNKDDCLNYCYHYEQTGFNKHEIDVAVRSGYSKTNQFGTKYFNDDNKIKSLTNDLKKGVSKEEIMSKYNIKDEETLNDITPADSFWFLTTKGKIGIDNFKYKTWLESNGFYKYYPDGSESFIFIKVQNNIIDVVNDVKIKDFVLNFLIDKREYEVYQYMTNNNKYFKDDFLNTIDGIDVRFKEDTEDNSFLYFKSNAVKITKDNVDIIDYLDLDGFVWKKQIIDCDFNHVPFESSVYNNFIYLVSGQDQDRYNSIISVIGYLLHSYKTSANNKAIIINDETISDNPNGGSGKGIFCNAFKYVKKVDTIDGKQFDFNKNFAYQTLNADTQILVFDDVEKSFNFENLFSVITEGITIEKKNKDAIKIPVTRSPKIIITTNYTIGGVGGSFDRRKFEIEFSSYFNANYTPEMEFKGLLFDSWDNNEWDMFYTFMIECLQYYLKHKLVVYKHKNLELRKLHQETSQEFVEFMEENLRIGERINKTTLFENFRKEYPDFEKWLKQKRFKIWLDILAKYKGLKTEHGVSMDGRWVLFTGNNKNINNEEVPF
jgi:hypothetical protein